MAIKIIFGTPCQIKLNRDLSRRHTIFRRKEPSANSWFFDLASAVLQLPIDPLLTHFPTHPMTPMGKESPAYASGQKY